MKECHYMNMISLKIAAANLYMISVICIEEEMLWEKLLDFLEFNKLVDCYTHVTPMKFTCDMCK